MDCVCDSAGVGRKLAQGLASVTRPAALGVLVSLLLVGCATEPCRTGRTGGWFSGWGSGGANAFTVGLHRTWGECADRTPGASQHRPDPGPAPSAEPASELQVSPSDDEDRPVI